MGPGEAFSGEAGIARATLKGNVRPSVARYRNPREARALRRPLFRSPNGRCGSSIG